MKTKLYGLDHARALAIILVFMYHYGRLFESPQWVTEIGKFGWTGVDLFFVLSGFLIASQLFVETTTQNGISLKEFFIKRFFRILPAYLLVVLVYFLFPALREREAPAPLWKYLTFTQNLGLDLRYQGTFSHAWSLCIEEQFYLLLPVILIILIYYRALKKGWIFIASLFVLGFAARMYCWYSFVVPMKATGTDWVYWYKCIYYPTYARLDGLLAGISIAAIFAFKPVLKERLARHGNLWIFTGLLILAGAYFVCSDEQSMIASVAGFPLTDTGYGFLILGAVSHTSFLYKVSSRVTTLIATLSYAIYLTHKIVIHVTQQYVSKLNIQKDSNLMFVICIAGSLLAGYVLHVIIEKPFLKLRKRLI